MNPNRFLILTLAAALALVFAGASPAPARERVDLDDPAARADEYPNVHWYPQGCYIPGYGMSDPDYIYAHTDTVSVRVVNQVWVRQDETLAIPPGTLFSGTASVDLLPALAGLVDDLAVTPGDILTFAEGKTVTVRLVTFRTRFETRFAGYRLYSILRFNYELWRASRDYIFMPKWERVGESYSLDDRAEEPRILTRPAAGPAPGK